MNSYSLREYAWFLSHHPRETLTNYPHYFFPHGFAPYSGCNVTHKDLPPSTFQCTATLTLDIPKDNFIELLSIAYARHLQCFGFFPVLHRAPLPRPNC